MLIFRMFIRLAIGFISLLIYMHLLGKMQIAPNSALDQIGNYVLGGIIGGIIYNMDISLLRFFLAILSWGSLMLLVNYFKSKNLKAKRTIEGKPILLMDNGQFKTKSFNQINLTADDIIPKLHQMGYPSINQIKTIWLESNGQLTVIKKNDNDLGWILIEDGQINHIDLERLNKSEGWLTLEINKRGYDIKDIFCLEYDNNNIYIYPYNNNN